MRVFSARGKSETARTDFDLIQFMSCARTGTLLSKCLNSLPCRPSGCAKSPDPLRDFWRNQWMAEDLIVVECCYFVSYINHANLCEPFPKPRLAVWSAQIGRLSVNSIWNGYCTLIQD